MPPFGEALDYTPPTDVRRGLFNRMPARGTYTCDCEHAKAARAAVASGDDSCYYDDGPVAWSTIGDKPKGYELYDLLGQPKTIVAPMVEQSELAFRILTKRYGADLTYSPMINSACFVKEHAQNFRIKEFSTCPADTNMFVQFCGHSPETLVEAARMVEHSGCKAIDLNLGCPQGIARRGFYGSFLMDDLPLVQDIVKTMDQHLHIPVTVKIRVFPDVMHTLHYAKMLVDAGAALLCVHGRLREEKGAAPGEARWDQIKMVKEALNIPVFANGNVWSHSDLDQALVETHCDAVMSADTLLWEPRLFSNPQRFLVSGRHFNVTDVEARKGAIATALEYLEICATHPTQANQMKSHLFKMTHHSLQIHTAIRTAISEASSTREITLVQRYQALMHELLDLENSLQAGAPKIADEDYPASIMQLGNVDIPTRNALSRITSPPDAESEYVKEKAAKAAELEEEVNYAIFD
eukprot:TRINITY_DN17631_c0_g1_i1.p1 TRINITY_DN17631_c0_g1~~TRINITY_DN17631_c0_g1_i1.p1  ORF type:complete len:484 (+),score=177.07 TRINITY_DN17631_c0_g1_i1:55-1452(+)